MSTKKPHILILPKWYPNSSDPQLGIFIQNQAQLISEHFEVSVIFVQSVPNCPKPYLIKEIKNSGITEIRVYFNQSRHLSKIKHFYKYRRAQNIGLNHLSKPVDLVHVNVPIRPAMLALRLYAKNKIPFLITEHWSGHLNGTFNQKSTLYKWYYKRLLSKASKVTVVSQALFQKISLLVDKDITIIPNLISSAREALPKINDANTQIISVSDLNNQTKNITGLLKAFAEALTVNDKLQLTIIGDGPDKNLIIDAVRELNIENHISLLGRKTQSEVLKLITQYDFYICNSNVETFGMTVAEAINAGLPVISTKCGGPESFVNAENGILIPVNDNDTLSKAILDMSESYKSFDDKQLHQSIAQRFGRDVILDQWKSLYQSILNE